MAVSRRNIEKFFDDHPELADRREEVMSKLGEGYGDDKNAVSGGTAEKALGNLSKQFFAEATTDPDHIAIGLQDLKT